MYIRQYLQMPRALLKNNPQWITLSNGPLAALIAENSVSINSVNIPLLKLVRNSHIQIPQSAPLKVSELLGEILYLRNFGLHLL